MPGASERNKGGLLSKFRRADSTQRDEVVNEQQQQLLLLFEKRNQIKREFGKTLDELEALRNEHADLMQRHAYYKERLDGLEAMLANPERGQNAIIYYRLDSLWKLCRKLLEARRDELVAKFEQLEKQKLIDNFKASAVEQQRQLEQKFAQYDSIYQEMAENLKEVQEQLRRANKFWHYFRRKQLGLDVIAAEEQVAPIVAQRDECLAELERVRDREPPPFKGLSVAAKREINIQLLALTQYLYVQFSENDLAPLARATRDKHPGASKYGTPQECLSMEKPIADAVARLKSDPKRAERLKRRGDHLRQYVQFTGNTDTIPDAQSLSRIVLSLGSTSMSIDAVRGDLLVNVLEQGYWNVDELLLKESS
ncbi:MAG TPA: hypothetical protein VF275_04970 [Gammaproteobacteria bacterium]